MKLIVRDAVARDLERIYEFVAQDSPANAQRVVTRIHDVILKVVRGAQAR